MWKDILKKSSSISLSSIELINEVMSDGQSRTIKEILDEMWKIVESHNSLSARQRIASKGHNKRLTGRSIPTSKQIEAFLIKNYSSGLFHNETGEELPKTTNLRRNTTRKYYR